ncbi:hypothetical protein [Acinetobacter guerrae]|uniref:hypothetical protein n=1 Tax=Acinetobacter guerrae TaxID=1843371 RepID=UPI00125F075A|nr:hypothetical protein [Acinetobacter guerrae]
MNTKYPTLNSSQQGFATILVVLLVGLALASSVLGTAYYLKSSQNSLATSHALTNAQSGAWTGVEVFRKYLSGLDGPAILNLDHQTAQLNIQGGREIKINQIQVSQVGTNPEKYQVSAHVQNISERSEASSTIEIIYEITPSHVSTSGETTPGTANNFDSVMNFYGGLNVSGDIQLANAGDKAVINVEGDFSAGGISLTGVKTINATGDVSLGSSAVVENIYSNGTIVLQGSATVTNIASAQKEIQMNSWGTPQGYFYANENIYLKGADIKSADTLKSITSTVWSRIGTAIAKENITCVGTGWSNFDSLQAKNLINCPTVTGKTHSPPIATPQGAFAPVSLSNKPIINALNSKYVDEANYIFKFNTTLNRPIVTINNIQDIPNGDYEIGKYSNNNTWYWGNLCKELNTDSTCRTAVVGNLYPNLSQKQRISYSSGLWTVDDEVGNSTGSVGSSNPPTTPSLAPGVMLFYGNVSMPRGLFVNTILATGNIQYGASITIYAPNYAGPNSTCNVSGYKMPLNLCLSASAMTKASIGNVALLAGSCADDSSVTTCEASYTGGTVTLGASSYVYGNIIAGNVLETSGSSHILGAILAAALGNVGQGNKLGNTTTVDFNGINQHENFDPSIPKDEDTTPPSDDSSDNAKIRWARYI